MYYIDTYLIKSGFNKNDSEAKRTDELMERGVPKSDIVLGFPHPSVRGYSGFAVA